MSAQADIASTLAVEGVHAGYGQVSVLHDINLSVHAGEVVAVLGANGAGKTTLLRTIAGSIMPRAGTIRFNGEDISRLPAQEMAARGMGMVPEGGRLFPFMTVQENLELGAFNRAARSQTQATMKEVMALFPRLGERRQQHAGKLSGGERQMCAIARALMSRPSFLMLDEPSLGLAPVIVEQVFGLIRRLVDERGLTVLLVEQNISEALEICGRAYILGQGNVVRSGTGAELRDDPAIRKAYMGL